MMSDMYADVLAFHQKFGCAIGDRPQSPPVEVEALRIDLLEEELEETVEAMRVRDLPGVADGLADLIYVALGAAITYGIDLRPVWDLVHASNMAKEGGATRADGKILKPEGWTPPDVIGEIVAQRATASRTPAAAGYQQGVAYTIADIWDAFEAGAKEARANGGAPSDELISRTADAYCKTVHPLAERAA